MTSLEDLKSGLKVTGTLPDQSVAIVDVKWHGSTAVELLYKRADGQPGTQLLFRDDESKLQHTTPRIFKVWSYPNNPRAWTPIKKTCIL
jgi:hypothetical protein